MVQVPDAEGVSALAQELGAGLEPEGVLDLELERALGEVPVVDVVPAPVEVKMVCVMVREDVVVGQMGRDDEAAAVGMKEQDEDEEVVVSASNTHMEEL